MLRRGGRIAGYVIHTPAGLGPSGERRVVELCPREVLAEAPYDELHASAGLEVSSREDVTDEFRATCEAILEEREALEAELRAEQGDEVFEEEHGKKQAVLAGIDEGLLQRSLIVADRP